MKSTPIKVIEETVATQPLARQEERCQNHGQGREVQTPVQPSDAAKDEKHHKDPSQRSRFIHESKRLAKELQDSISSSTLPLDPSD
ncbi:hypothetical protein BaRGS_00012118 [Batillaria attramentaria]|uniref:Uncharacterized protein n=1 Tax=Batillaria attramentaria TaxID=370345 RepID=A0ABD0LC74_9CAEN